MKHLTTLNQKITFLALIGLTVLLYVFQESDQFQMFYRPKVFNASKDWGAIWDTLHAYKLHGLPNMSANKHRLNNKADTTNGVKSTSLTKTAINITNGVATTRSVQTTTNITKGVQTMVTSTKSVADDKPDVITIKDLKSTDEHVITGGSNSKYTIPTVASTSKNVVPSVTNVAFSSKSVVPNVTNVASTSKSVVPSVTNVASTSKSVVPSVTNVAFTSKSVVPSVTNVAFTPKSVVPSVTNVASNSKSVVPSIPKIDPAIANSVNTTKKAPIATTVTSHMVTVVTPTVTNSNKNVTKPQRYICLNLNGRLGNHMYMFASVFGVCRRKNMKMIMQKDPSLKDVFQIDGTYETNWNLCKNAPNVPESSCCRLSVNIFNVSNEKTVHVSGYLQSYKYFDDYKDEVRKIFTFRQHVLVAAEKKLANMLANHYPGKNVSTKTLVGVHIRRGDYLHAGPIKFGYRVATKEYMYQAQSYMQNRFKNVTFIVCSNDIVWSTDVFKNQTDTIITPLGPAHVDMALLSLTEHMIMTVGTYGFWASWLVNGTVVYYRNFTDPKTPFGRNFDEGYHDTYPPYWVGL